jgi:hypothetical protein
MPTKRQTEAEITRVLRALRSLPEDADRDRRTALLRDLAEATVEFREHFLTTTGEPDWAGRTGIYRAEVNELYAGTGFKPLEAKAIQKLARYHVANILRERLSTEDIEAIGLRAESPRERQQEFRDRTAAIVATASAAAAGAGIPETPEERIAYLRGVLATLNQVRPISPADRADPQYVVHFRTAKRLIEEIVTRSRHIIRTWPAPEGEDHIIP